MLLIMLQACIEDTIEGVGKSSIQEGEEIPKSETSGFQFLCRHRIDHQNPKNGGREINRSHTRHRTGPQKTLIEILQPNTPIDPSKYMRFVHSPKYGAITTFSGTTRDTFEGKSMVELRYEAYEAMAARKVGSICESPRSRWDVGSVAVAHRLGWVGVGEISVFVALSSVHRGESLDACSYLIDEIKGSVPIWKKEVYGDGCL
ncbi:hypothetical protein Scep_026693 [Stephania cephalantha]|uniref:Molybdopterin synthase catalytic subunit n=1 Tax=Stephania cephalantha TaxID=152367 RepID=A0AAP0EL29_9MAGN